MNEQNVYYAYENSFTEFIFITEKDIAEINERGILLKDKQFIDFSLCTENFRKTHKGCSGKCVGERFGNVFIFYTQPKPAKLVYMYKKKLRELFSPTRNRIFALTKKINQFGFSIYDMT